jgi:membrane protein implicated in regulation of membrane protease activity
MAVLENLGDILLWLPFAAVACTCFIPPIGGILFLIWLFLLFSIASAVISCIFEDVFKSKSKSKSKSRANRVRARAANGRFIKTSVNEAPTAGQAL